MVGTPIYQHLLPFYHLLVVQNQEKLGKVIQYSWLLLTEMAQNNLLFLLSLQFLEQIELYSL